jgi:hypothetical protein
MTDLELKFAIKAIKAAKKLGVSSMKLGTLEFELEKETPRTRPTLKVSKKDLKQQEETLKQVNFDAAMNELATMNVEDPAAFERAIVENDLIDKYDGGDNLEEIQVT